MGITGLILTLVTVSFQTCPSYDTRGGWYDVDTKKIAICTNFQKSASDADKALIHERSHWFWFNKLSTGERSEYTKVWNTSGTWYATPYARTKLEEDFAETSWFYATNYKTLRNKNWNSKIDYVAGMYWKYGYEKYLNGGKRILSVKKK